MFPNEDDQSEEEANLLLGNLILLFISTMQFLTKHYCGEIKIIIIIIINLIF